MTKSPKVGDYVRNSVTKEIFKVKAVNRRGFAAIPAEVLGIFVYRAGYYNYVKFSKRQGTP